MTEPLDTRVVMGWDSRNWAKGLDLWRAHLPADGPLRVLELGCGPGGLSMWFAAQGHQVLCTDTGVPEPSVIDMHSRYGLADRFEYGGADATALPYVEAFDVIVTKSVLGGVGQGGWDLIEQAVGQIHQALKPGGVFLFAENLEGTRMHGYLRRRFRRWGSKWHYFRLAEVRALLGQFRSLDLRTAGFLGLLGPKEPVRRALGLVDTLVFDRVVPPRYRYIVFGAAHK